MSGATFGISNPAARPFVFVVQKYLSEALTHYKAMVTMYTTCFLHPELCILLTQSTFGFSFGSENKAEKSRYL
jgi:hypothetical protein